MEQKTKKLSSIIYGFIAMPILAAGFGYFLGEKWVEKQAEHRNKSRLESICIASPEERKLAELEYENLVQKMKSTKAIETNSPSAPKYEAPRKNNYNEPTNPITPEFIERITKKESRYNPKAISKKGARGLMQIMPDTWYEITQKIYGKRLSYDLAFHPDLNKEVGINYLKHIDRMLTNSLPRYAEMPIEEQQKYIAAAYNGGPGRLLRKKGNIKRMYKETRDYVQKVSGSS